MKKQLLLFAFLLGYLTLWAQPNTFNYQAVVRDTDGNLITNQQTLLRLSITDSEQNIYYEEEHQPTTSEFGQIQIEVGGGTLISGSFVDIPWGSAQLLLNVDMSMDEGNTFTNLGQSPLLAVPYAFYSATGDPGPEGPAGNGIETVEDNGDGTLTFHFTDGSTYTTPNLAGPTIEDQPGNLIYHDSTGWVGTDAIKIAGSNVAICTSPAISRLLVHGDTAANTDDPIFEVKNKDGNVVFAVYQNGVEVNVDESSQEKGLKGGFAVGGLTGGKDSTVQYFRVTPDSVRVYLREDTTKAQKGGFAVGGLTSGKGSTEYLRVTRDSTRVYVNNTGKAQKGGFAVGGLTWGKNKSIGNEYLHVSPDSVRIYIDNSSTKAQKGGFAVGGLTWGKRKDMINEYLRVSEDSVRIYIDDSQSKAQKGGFAVGGLTWGKTGPQSYFNVEVDTAQTIVPAENRILWYPTKNAFLTGNVLIEDPDSVGTNSMATGFESKAIGKYSQAMGYKAIARGDYSTAIGDSAMANGLGSFSFGEQTKANGNGAFAFGKEAIADGGGSYAFGSNLTGIKTQALDENSFAMGLACIADGIGAIAIGTSNTSGANYSFTAGRNNIANNTGATALGHESVAGGNYSTALGYNTETTHSNSIAMGTNSTATGNYSIVLGYGSSTNLDRANSTAIGYQCHTNSGESFAAGSGATAGNSSLTYGMAYAIGYNVTATGGSSLCLGASSSASGYGSRAIGYESHANANRATAIGPYNEANGDYSTALGEHTVANTRSEFVIGSGNVPSSGNATNWQSTDPLFVIGNSPNASAPSNALIVYKNANIKFNGNLMGAYGTIAQSTDEWLRLNPDGSHTSGIYTPGLIRTEGGIWLGDDEYIIRMSEDLIGTLDHFRVSGEIRQGSTDYGGYEIQTAGQIYANDYILAMGGIHIGGSSDPGTDNLRVDGTVQIDGNVGIGRTPTAEKLWVDNGITYGAYTTSGWQHSSDKRLKKNIKPIQSSLSKILALQGVSFNWREGDEKEQVGFIAQDVIKYIPEVVKKSNDGYYSIAYGNLSPVIVEAIKEQETKINKLEKENEELKQKINEILEKLSE